ncbi:MAG: regulatory protein RecX [Gammaproteobacteria bacterium]
MDLLARREHSAAEMRAKLLVREFDADEVDLAIERLVADGLLSDARFAEAFVASRIRKGQGPTRIRGELKQRGVAVALIDVQLDRVDVDWTAMARSVREKKFGPERPADYREQAKQSRFLQYRGFSGEQIRHAFEQD